MRKRRYEILLPVIHNDGRPVEEALIVQTWDELIAHFGGLSANPHMVLVVWTHEGKKYEEEMLRVMVDVEEASDHLAFFPQFKAVLLQRFQQIEIYIASYPIDLV